MSTRAKARLWRILAACAGVAALVLLLAAVVAALAPRASPPTSVPGYAEINDGMTEPQVEALLGGPRGVYGPGKRLHYHVVTAYGDGPGCHSSVWYFPGCEVTVSFDGGGLVRAKRIDRPTPRVRAWRWCADVVGGRWP